MRRIVVSLETVEEIASVDVPDGATDEEMGGLIDVVEAWFGASCCGSCPVPEPEADEGPSPKMLLAREVASMLLAREVASMEARLGRDIANGVRAVLELPSVDAKRAHGRWLIGDLERLHRALEPYDEPLPPEPDPLAAIVEEIVEGRES